MPVKKILKVTKSIHLLDDVEELFKSTQEFIDKSKHVKVKKRRSHAIKMSATKKNVKSKNTSIDSPLSREGGSTIGLKIPKFAPKKKRTLLMGHTPKIHNNRATHEEKMRQSLGNDIHETGFSVADLPYLTKKKHKKKH